MRTNSLRLLLALFTVSLVVSFTQHIAFAADKETDSGFSIQVSPSPLIATVKPGETSIQELRIRNTGSKSQELKMGLSTFAVNSQTGKVDLGNSVPKDVEQFVTFSQPNFTAQAGEIITQRVTIAMPESAGFTYSFAITISQQNPPKAPKGSSAINGSVAVFILISVDKPGATRTLELGELTATKRVFEFLPATFTMNLKNVGNSLVQPKGTIYIQRHSNDKVPIAAIDINSAGGFILPKSSRELSVQWNDGFPHYQAKTLDNGKTENPLNWGGSDISKLRFGRYVAKMVAVYNDGNRDVPIDAEVTFWVIPFRIIFVIALIVLIIVIGFVSIIRKSTKLITRGANRRAKSNKTE